MSAVWKLEKGLCRCCHSEGSFHDLLQPRFVLGQEEYYLEMLRQSFGIELDPMPGVIKDLTFTICETCIIQLRDAANFKRQVLLCEKIFKDLYNKDILKAITPSDHSTNFVKVEVPSFQDELETPSTFKHSIKVEIEQLDGDDEDDFHMNHMNFDEEDNEPLFDLKTKDTKKSPKADKASTTVKKEKQTLKVKKKAGAGKATATGAEVGAEAGDEGGEQPKRVPDRKSRAGKGYKKYERKNLDECMEAIKTDVMTKREAAKFFNVPYKTVDRKLRSEVMKNDSTETKNDEKKEKFKKFLQEIKTILKFTNATPYKSKTGQFFCAYCRMKFDNTVELRLHTSSVHAGERFSGVDLFMKASWLNEIIKLDIVDLRCIICPAPIEKWNDMFLHLKEKHKVEFDEAYTRAIPYKLTAPFVCTLCDERCDSYSILDLHMNTHYSNYICGECGDSFLAESRLKMHVETHSTERLKCPFCPKFFALEKYRKKHVDGVHQQGYFHKCRYCKEQFVNEFHRHKHMEKNHSDKIKPISCKFCEKIFTFRPYYLKHTRLTHTKKGVKPHKCSKCDKMFATKNELTKHEKWHLGHHRQTCLVCNRSFASKQYLEKHYNKVHADTDVSVLETDQR